MKPLLLVCTLIIAAMNSYSETNQIIPLWPEGAPGALGNNSNDIPTLTCYLPATNIATGAAMVILPGGGYAHLADHEGRDFALWLADHGIAGFVLKYRLGSSGYHHPAMIQDASRALRLVRSKSAEWNLDARHIGIMGSSAGGHLASTLLTHFDSGNATSADAIERQSSRPDLGILCYPVITMEEKTHGGSKKNLLGENPSPALIEELSNEKHVTHETPPCFLFHTAEDKTVDVKNSLDFADALHRAGVLFDLHIYQHGGHGMGLGGPRGGHPDPSLMHPWTVDCLFWLKQLGFVK
jgi:acetyl esterase/lipase